MIKSGGEWISSVHLEGLLVEHPAVVEAAVVAIADDRWQERPLAFVVVGGRRRSRRRARRAAPAPRPSVPKWWLPDEFRVVEALPRTGVGKIDKRSLAERCSRPTGGGTAHDHHESVCRCRTISTSSSCTTATPGASTTATGRWLADCFARRRRGRLRRVRRPAEAAPPPSPSSAARCSRVSMPAST